MREGEISHLLVYNPTVSTARAGPSKARNFWVSYMAGRGLKPGATF